MKKQLNQRQYDFCINYIKNGFNAYDAALTAGYSVTFAKARSYELVNHPAVQQHLSESYSQTIDKLGMSFESKLKVLQQIIDSFMNKSGQPLSHQDAKVIIQAISVLNEMQGHLAPDRRLSVTVDATKERLAEARKAYEYDEY